MFRASLPLAVLAFALVAADARGGDCPWLDAGMARQALLDSPGEPEVAVRRAPSDPDGLLSTSLCHYRIAGDPAGELYVAVRTYGSHGGALRVYGRLAQSQAGTVTRPGIDGHPAFVTAGPATSSTYAVKGAMLVQVTHNYGKAARQAIARKPEGAVLSTYEIARRVLART